MNYHIITFGCQMNKSDSERIAATLENKDYKPASKIEEADLIVVNMCSVRQSAVDRVYGKIKDFAKLKTQNPNLKTILTGCILKSDRQKFVKKFDLIWDTKNSNSQPWLSIQVLPKYQKYQTPFAAFIPISNGCNNFCTYCVVPHTRGKECYREKREIIGEARDLIRKGCKKITLLGQNVNSYPGFPQLLKEINALPGNFKITFLTSHPKDFSDELINVMAKCEKIIKFLNLPVQSGDDEILKKMNRPYTVEQYKNLVKKIRKKIPDINLSTDVIVGFPGETKKQFENTVKLFKEIKFNTAYIAKYSPRSGTAAFQMKDNVPLEEKKRREKILREIINTRR